MLKSGIDTLVRRLDHFEMKWKKNFFIFPQVVLVSLMKLTGILTQILKKIKYLSSNISRVFGDAVS